MLKRRLRDFDGRIACATREIKAANAGVLLGMFNSFDTEGELPLAFMKAGNSLFRWQQEANHGTLTVFLVIFLEGFAEPSATSSDSSASISEGSPPSSQALQMH